MGPIYRQLGPSGRKKVNDIMRDNYAFELRFYDKRIARLGNEETAEGERAAKDIMDAALHNQIEAVGAMLMMRGHRIYSLELEAARDVAANANHEIIRTKIDSYLQDAIREQVADRVATMGNTRNR